MAIQFHCVACGKPIEIDEGWGGRLVECPYCHDTITAPAFSTAGGTDAVVQPHAHSALEASPEPRVEAVPYGAPVQGRAVPGGNRLAVVALIMAMVALLLGLGAMVGAYGAMTNALGGRPTEEQANAFFQQAAEQAAPWFLKVCLAMLGAMCCWLVGVVCGIVAACREPRGVAIAALILCGVPLLVVALGVMQAG